MSDQITISFDLDGVVYDFPKAFAEMHGIEIDLNEWSFGLSQDEFKPLFGQFKAANGFRFGDPLVDPDRVWDLYQHPLVTVIYTTARNETQRYDTERWLREHRFPGSLYMSDDKTLPVHLYGHTSHVVGVDDNGQNAIDMAGADMDSYLVSYGHNVDVDTEHHGIIRVRDCDDFISLVWKNYLS